MFAVEGRMEQKINLTQPDYAAAIAYALCRLRTELSPLLTYHNLMHTEGDVMPAVARLARLGNLAESDVRLLEVGAAFHDLGQIKTSLGHERVGIEIMSEVLPGLGFSATDIARLTGMIHATEMPQTPRNNEQALLADADLDSLGRDDFFPTSTALWHERAACGMDIPWQTWLELQLQFLRRHSYFTPVAQALRGAGKQKNIEMLERLISATHVPGITVG
jgi:predicted metal-dependent HD superfamily phosphohydrolase